MKEKVKRANILAEVEMLKNTGGSRTRGLFAADDFQIDIRLARENDPRQNHICTEDEFIYILDGEVEAHVEGEETVILHSGEGIMVKAGVIHNMLPN